MVEARFPITEARQELGFTPAPSVRADIDVRQGDVGGAIGEVVIAGARELRRGSERRAIIEQKRQEMMDANLSVRADKMRQLADEERKQFQAVNPQETWEEFTQKQTQEISQQVSALDFSPDALIAERLKSETYSAVSTAKSLTAATLQLRKDTVDAQTEAVVDAFRIGGAKEQLEAVTRFRDNGANMGKDKVEVLSDIKAAREVGKKLREEDAINAVHAALEIAGTTGNFEAAKTLATSPSISEAKQTTLRNTIGVTERAIEAQAKDAQEQTINQATSDAIREFYAGTLTVPELNKRHEAGVIKDSEFKSMMGTLQQTTPADSDAFAAGDIRRGMGDFEVGAITRAELDKVVLDNYAKLDGPDRSKVVSDIEDVATKVIGTARTNAYDEGRGLMSVQFIGIKSVEDLASIFAAAGLSDEEKKRINRRWQAEVANRDLYERAIDDRFREMRKDGVTDTQKFQAESLRVLRQYERRKRLELEQLETEIREERQAIISTASIVNKPVGEMTTTEKQAELQRIRELKRLAQ